MDSESESEIFASFNSSKTELASQKNLERHIFISYVFLIFIAIFHTCILLFSLATNIQGVFQRFDVITIAIFYALIIMYFALMILITVVKFKRNITVGNILIVVMYSIIALNVTAGIMYIIIAVPYSNCGGNQGGEP